MAPGRWRLLEHFVRLSGSPWGFGSVSFDDTVSSFAGLAGNMIPSRAGWIRPFAFPRLMIILAL